MTRTLHIDIETYSAVDLRKVSVYRYVEDPEFQILMAGWSLDGGPVEVAIGEDAVARIPGLWDPGRKVAHNAPFERICFSKVAERLGRLKPHTFLDPAEWHDTQAVAAEWGYPQKLELLAKWLGGEQKDSAGTRLVNFFCKPNRLGQRNLPEDYPEEWAEFVEYCRQDVVTLKDVDVKLGDFPTETERQVYLSDQRINDLGIAMDRGLAHAAAEAAEDNRMVQELEISRLTGVVNPGSGDQMKAWFRKQKLPMPDLKAETVTKALQGPLSDTQRRVLELRQELALVAAKKYPAALAGVSSDGRLRGQFRFFGAHTGRWSGRGVQLHNLTRAQLASETETEAAIVDLKLGLGADSATLKALVRSMFVGPFTVVDYAAIEARVIAWLAGEEWALEAFWKGRDIYVETAERMGPDFDRSSGKIAVLALGYGGGPNSLQVMAGAYGMQFTEREALKIVRQWREANAEIVSFWHQMSDAFRHGGPVGEHITVEADGDDRLIRLPSGRPIVYHNCKWTWENTLTGDRRLSASFQSPVTQFRTRTYGGRLAENVTQAVARDVLAEALVRLHRSGYDVVGHVHDEILVEGVGTGSIQAVRALMTSPPGWAAGLPIDGEGFTTRRYRKG